MFKNKRPIICAIRTGIFCVSLFLFLLPCASAAEQISYGQTVSGTITSFNDVIDYTFNAAAGDWITARIADKDFGASPSLTILDSNYNVLSFAYTYKIDFTIPRSGTFILRLKPVNHITGDFTLSLQRFNNPVGAVALLPGRSIDVNFARASDMMLYTINVSKGDFIAVRYQETVNRSRDFAPTAWLYKQNGTTLITESNGTMYYYVADNPGSLTIFVIASFCDGTGICELTWQKLNNPATITTLSLNELRTDQLNKRTGMNSYRLDVNTGEEITIEPATVSTFSGTFDPYLLIYSQCGIKNVKIPNGTHITHYDEQNTWKVIRVEEGKNISLSVERAGALYITIAAKYRNGTGSYTIDLSSSAYPRPEVGSIKPSSGTFYTGDTEIFSAEYSDANGAGDIKFAYFRIGSGSGELLAKYNHNDNLLYIGKKEGAGYVFQGGYAPGLAHTIKHQSGILDCSKTRVYAVDRDTLAVEWAVVFDDALAGTKDLFLAATDMLNGDSGYIKKGGINIERREEDDSLVKALYYLYERMDAYRGWEELRLIEDFSAPYPPQKQYCASLRDNVFAVLALLSHRSAQDILRSRLLVESIIWLKEHDPVFSDGRLRDAYDAVGFRADNFASIKGFGSSCGGLAWSIIALLDYHASSGETDNEFLNKVLAGTTDIGNFIILNFSDAANAGFYSGINYGDTGDFTLNKAKNTGDNFAVYAAFIRLYEATGDIKWLKSAVSAGNFIEHMFDRNKNAFYSDTLGDGWTPDVVFNKQALSADTLGLLATGRNDAFPVVPTLKMDFSAKAGSFSGFDFNTDKDGIWWEGTAQAALTYKLLGMEADYNTYIQQIENAQRYALNTNGSAIVQASKNGLTTGMPFQYYASPSISATSWFILSRNNYNPFWGHTAETIRPYAKIAVSDMEIEEGMEIEFDATASYSPAAVPIQSYLWSFGDGEHLYGQTVQHSYDGMGAFYVVLTVTDAEGNKNYDLVKIDVSEKENQYPIADAGPDQAIELGDPLTLSAAGSYDPDGTIVSYDWNLQDGTALSGPVVTYTYAFEGEYMVILTVTDDKGETDVDSCIIKVIPDSTPALNQHPVANAGEDRTGGTGGAISFDGSLSFDSDGSIERYFWSFGDGSFAEGEKVAHSYSSYGNYVASLTAVDNKGASAIDYCNVSISSQIIPDKRPPTGIITINNGSAGTDSREVALTLSAMDLDGGMGLGAEMSFSNDAVNWTEPEAYNTAKAWMLSDGYGVKTVYAKFKDAMGNWMLQPVSDEIILNPASLQPPTIDPVLNPTNQSNIILSGMYQAGTTVLLSCSTASFLGEVVYSGSRMWRCALGGLREGMNTIMVTASDTSGRTSLPAEIAVMVETGLPRLNPYAEVFDSRNVVLSFNKDVVMEYDDATCIMRPNISWRGLVPLQDNERQFKIDTYGIPLAGRRYVVEVKPLDVKDKAGNHLDESYSNAVFIGPTSGDVKLLNIFEPRSPSPGSDLRFGYHVACAGDVNGDGYDDVIVSSRQLWFEAVPIAIYFGSPAMDSEPDVVMQFPEAGMLGYTHVAAAGDVNADGYDDVLVQAGSGSDLEEVVYLYLGGKNMDNVIDFKIADIRQDAAVFSGRGCRVSGVGDVNADGYDDFVVANIISADGSAGRKTAVYLGSDLSERAIIELQIPGSDSDVFWPTGGDVNGDGFPDVLLYRAGTLFIYYGGNNFDAQYDLSFELGQSVVSVGAGDVNGDGFMDILTQESSYTWISPDPQGIRVYLGGPGIDGVADVVIMSKREDSCAFGESAAIVDDLNKDGFDDIVIGSPLELDSGSGVGKAYVYLGGPDVGKGGEDYVVGGHIPLERFGHIVASAGDVNGDGYNEFIVGTYRNYMDAMYFNGGRAYLFTLAPLGPRLSRQVEVIDEHTIEIGFSDEVVGAANPQNYTISPSLGAMSVTQMSRNFFQVRAATGIQKTTRYTITAANIADSRGIPLDVNYNNAAFSSGGERPVVTNVKKVSYFAEPYFSKIDEIIFNISGHDPDGQVIGWSITGSRRAPAMRDFYAITPGPSIQDSQHEYNISFLEDGEYSCYIWLLDNHGNVSEPWRYDFIIDNHNPVITLTNPRPGLIIGMPSVDITGYVSDDNWPVLVRYWILGNYAGEQILTRDNPCFMLPHDKIWNYSVEIRAMDPAHNDTTIHLEQSDFIFDTMPPSKPDVEVVINKQDSAITASWRSDDPGSDIVEYKYAVGTSPGATNILGWTSNGKATQAIINNITLSYGSTYYVSVIAVNGMGMNSAVGVGSALVPMPVSLNQDNVALEISSPDRFVFFAGMPATIALDINGIPASGLNYRFLLDNSVIRDWGISQSIEYTFLSGNKGIHNLTAEVRGSDNQVKSLTKKIYVAEPGIKP